MRRTARSGSLVVGLGLAVLIETLVVHLWLGGDHPELAWSLTATSVFTIVWLAADYRALGRATLRLDSDALDVRIGWRGAVRVPLNDVAKVMRASWRDVPAAATPEGGDYRNLMKPAAPNVLVTLAAPVMIRFAGGLTRPARRLGLCVDDPDGFVAAFDAMRASAGAPAA